MSIKFLPNPKDIKKSKLRNTRKPNTCTKNITFYTLKYKKVFYFWETYVNVD